MKFTSFAVCAVLLLSCAAGAMAVPVIIVGDHVLEANTPMQPIDIYVTGGDAIVGVNLYCEIMTVGGGSITDPGAAPYIQAMDCLGTGAIFANNNDGQDDTDQDPADPDRFRYFEGREVVTQDGTEPAEGLIGTVYVNTEGIFDGTWDLVLSDRNNGGGSDFGDPKNLPDITDGTITVPEPVTLGLLGAGALGCLIRRRRR
jgi:hypothetical protein